MGMSWIMQPDGLLLYLGNECWRLSWKLSIGKSTIAQLPSSAFCWQHRRKWASLVGIRGERAWSSAYICKQNPKFTEKNKNFIFLEMKKFWILDLNIWKFEIKGILSYITSWREPLPWLETLDEITCTVFALATIEGNNSIHLFWKFPKKKKRVNFSSWFWVYIFEIEAILYKL